MVYAVEGGGNIDFDRIDSTAQFPLGHSVKDSAGGEWVYVKAGAALTAYKCYKIIANGLVGSSTAADDAVDDDATGFTGGFPCCWPQQAFSSGEFGWVQTASGDGTLTAFIQTGISADDKLYTTTTAGVLGKTAASHKGVVGEARAAEANSSGSDAAKGIYVAAPARVDTVDAA